MVLPGKIDREPSIRETSRLRHSEQHHSSARAKYLIPVDESLVAGTEDQFDHKTLELRAKIHINLYDKILMNRRVRLPSLKTEAHYILGEQKGGARSHTVLIPVDSHTLVQFFVFELQPFSTEEVLKMVESLKIERPWRKRTTTTAADAKNRPTVNPHRKTFHWGRLSMEFPGRAVGKPQTEETPSQRTSTQVWSDKHGVFSVNVRETLSPKTADHFDDGLLKLLVRKQLRSYTKILENKTVSLSGLPLKARYLLGEEKGGKRSHTCFIIVDPATIVQIVILERSPIPSIVVRGMMRTLRIEIAWAKKHGTKKGPTSGSHWRTLGAGERATAQEVAAAPRSTKSRAFSVANSCYIGGTEECYDTPHSAVGKAYYSNKRQCPDTFSEGPCPGKGRVGFCRVSTAQLVSFYSSKSNEIAELKKRCEAIYMGTWIPLGKKRPWPKNR